MADGTKFSGGRISGFREGWALKIATWGKAHYFRREGAGLAVSLCGSQDAAAGWLLEAGTFTHCQRCTALLAREAAKSVAVPPEAGRDEQGDHRTCDGKAGD
jgi:hypothetical protein